MKIIPLSVGTRGDIEPFLAIGKILKEKGHLVICAFPEQFRNLTEELNLQFVSLVALSDEVNYTLFLFRKEHHSG